MSKEELKQVLEKCDGLKVGQYLEYAKRIDGLTAVGVSELSFLLKDSGKKDGDLGLQLLLWL